MRQHYILLLGQLFAPAATAVYTGFNYGTFWGTGDNVKKAADFRDSFNFAKNLSSPVPFDSARLFTCKTAGSVDEPTGAFDAAVETKTNLLLGFWISPGTEGAPLDNIIKTEMSALSKGFQKHGQALADLVIGLSVGSEDIHRFEDAGEVGVAATEVTSTIKKVRDAIAASDFAKYMKNKPIGHVDVAKHVVVDGADFYGMTAYPYWSNDSITKGNERFHRTLEGVKQRAGDTPVWIAEMGWPFEGPQRGDAVASAQNLQTFWTEVGCSVVGKYNTFWFELIKDSEANQPDWGMIDSVTHKARIDLSCPGGPKLVSSAAPAGSSTIVLSTAPSKQPNTTTIVTSLNHIPWCVTVADIARDGNFIPVAGHPADPDGKCTPPPMYTGLP
ncbi:glycoside hydrolase superfamily, partial [Paraphoma chrysanthemicola]